MHADARQSDPIRYRDTRGGDRSRPGFAEVVMRGTAPGGGLYLPEALPHLPLEEIVALSRFPYPERARRVISAFGVDLEAGALGRLCRLAWGDRFAHDAIVPLRGVAPGVWVMELWHGPTASFKDLALQALPLFMAAASDPDAGIGSPPPGVPPAPGVLVLTATSGDTGAAALEAFADRAGTKVAVFYPADGVSDLQRLQMVTQAGGNVAVFAIEGDFDACQRAVKALFADAPLAARLISEHALLPASANSINWGRILPQVVFWVSAYADLVGIGAVRAGDRLDVTVPTGNFGNLLSAWYAKHIGVPLGRLICASNENDVLTRFLESGRYDPGGRPLVRTPSPAMDILVSSNLERLLFQLSGDPARVQAWQTSLAAEGAFEVDPATLAALGAEFSAERVEGADCLAAIRRVYEERGYLLDPHTAVAWEAAGRRRSETPMLVASTAHWAKFAPDVHRALAGLPPGAPLPEHVVAEGPLRSLARLAGFTVEQEVPGGLTDLEFRPVRFSARIAPTPRAMEVALLGWLTASR